MFWSEKKNKVKKIVFEATLKSAKNLVKQSCMSVDYYFIIDVFNTYKQGVEFRNQYLTIEQGTHVFRKTTDII